MTVTGIEAVEGLSRLEGLTPPSAAALEAPSTTQFADWMLKEAQGVNAEMQKAEGAVRMLAAGEPVNVHEVMLQLEQARLGFQMMLQVRNKVLEAYQEVMRMQV